MDYSVLVFDTCCSALICQFSVFWVTKSEFELNLRRERGFMLHLYPVQLSSEHNLRKTSVETYKISNWMLWLDNIAFAVLFKFKNMNETK